MRGIKIQSGGIRIKLLVFLIISIIMISGAVFLVSQQGPTPAAAGGAFTTALTEQDAAGSYDMLAGGFKKQITKEDWTAWVQFAFKDYDGKRPKLIRQEFIENVGNVYKKEQQPTRLTYELESDDKTYTFTIVLIKEKETWKVSETGRFEET